MTSPHVTREGHWHIDAFRLLRRSRGVRVWSIETEQKRPALIAWGESLEDDGSWTVWIGSRQEGSMHFRDGEDGSEDTMIRIPVPKARFGRRWSLQYDEDKWCVRIALVTIRRF